MGLAAGIAVGLLGGLWIGTVVWAPRTAQLTVDAMNLGACITAQAAASQRVMRTAVDEPQVMASQTAEEISEAAQASAATVKAWIAVLSELHVTGLVDPGATSAGLPCPYTL